MARMILIMFEISSGDMAHGEFYWQRPVKRGEERGRQVL